MSTNIVIGASSAIAQAVIQQLLQQEPEQEIIAVSRKSQSCDGVKTLTCDYSEADIQQCCQSLAHLEGNIAKIFICNGVLHSQDWLPEKRLEDVSAEQWLTTLQTNALLPLLWLKALASLIKGKQTCRIAVLSARVGSIGDNNLGGWYSYRASKAALNMALKCCAIEYARRAKNAKLIAFHPGTVDTQLSQPFQKNVPTGKLFSADFVAQQLLSILASKTPDDELEYLDWQGKTIPW